MKRFTLFLAVVGFVLLAAGTASAQDAPRIEPLSTIAGTRASSAGAMATLPSDIPFDDIDLLSDNTQADVADPLHPCWGNDTLASPGAAADNAGTYSVFTTVIHPGGVLHVSTVGSNYDTVLSVFAYVNSTIPIGPALACDDDIVDGFTVASEVSVLLPSGVYLIMVSDYYLSVATNLDLQLEVHYVPDAAAPSNDVSSAPLVLSPGVALSQANAHHATDDAAELLLNAECEMYNSVWYTFTFPDDAAFQFTMHGSQLRYDADNGVSGTAIAIYFGSTLVDCSEGGINPAVSAPMFFGAGVTVTLRVGARANQNLMSGSLYKIKPVATSVQLASNEEFTAGLTGWKTKNFEAGDAVNVDDQVVINAGTKKKTISQSISAFAGYVKFTKGAMISIGAYYTYTGAATGKFTLKVTYSDGKPPTVIKATFKSGGGTINRDVPMTSGKVKSIKISAAVNPGSGVVTISYITALFYRDPSVARAAQGVLPLPPAAASEKK